MNGVDRQDIFKKMLLSIWGMVTMVLLFSVILMANEMLRRGHNPLGAIQTQQAGARATDGQDGDRTAPLEMQEVVLYFASQDGRMLAPEIRSIPRTNSTVQNCRNALEVLIQGPHDILLPVLPPATRINALYLLDDGELVIDFSRELQTDPSRFRSAGTEALFAFAVASSLTQRNLQAPGEPVNRVRFLLEGTRPQETFPAHVDLGQAIKPDPAWLEPTQGRAAYGR
jgi:spore germination protein GerM